MECALDTEGVRRVREWLSAGRPGVAWLTGASGSGMTQMVRAATADMEAVWLTGANLRCRAFLRDVCSNAVAVNFKRKVLVLDELDAVLHNETVMADVAHVCKHHASRLPVVCILKATRAASACDLARKACLVEHFAPPSAERMLEVVRGALAREGVPFDEARAVELCRAAPGDIRHVLQTLRASSAAVRDVTLHTADAVARVFDDVATVAEALRMFGSDPGALAGGVFESYTRACDEVRELVAHADNASAADVVHEHVQGRQRWDMMDIHGALAVASAAVLLPKRAGVKLTKYGTTWNKAYVQASKAKHARGVHAARAERGLSALDGTDLAFVRAMLASSLARSPADGARVCRAAGLGAVEALAVMRLWDTGYKLSTHARLKTALAQADGPGAPTPP